MKCEIRKIKIWIISIFLGQEHNFDRHDVDAADMLTSPYDFNSIMHYGKYSFAMDGKCAFLYLLMLFKISLMSPCHGKT